jgi:hypothetical protein
MFSKKIDRILKPKSRLLNGKETPRRHIAKTQHFDPNENRTVYKKYVKSNNLTKPGSESKKITKTGNRNNNNNNENEKIFIESQQSEANEPAAKRIMQNKLFRYLASGSAVKKPRRNSTVSKPKLNSVKLDDEILAELNKNFENLITVRFAEAAVLVRFIEKDSTIFVRLTSVANRTHYDVENVSFLLDVFYKKRFRNRMVSSMSPFSLGPNEKKSVSMEFLVETDARINLKMIMLNVLVVGRVSELGRLEEEVSDTDTVGDNSGGLMLNSDSASGIQILGGVRIRMKDYVELFK